MIIKTKSRRLAFAARLARLLPPALSGRFLKLMYPHKLAKKENAEFVAKSSLADITFSYPRAEPHATYFAVRGFTEWQNIVIANTVCRKGDTVIDVGSNIGTETLLFSRTVGPQGKVVSFEPFPDNFATLERLVELNKLENITIYQKAVSDKIGTLRFSPPMGQWNTGNGRLLEDSSEAKQYIEVDVCMLDQLFKAGEFSLPRLMVMDCEGAELFVLRGAENIINQSYPIIILEVMPPFLKYHGLSQSDLFDFLDAKNYRIWTISGWGLKPALRKEEKAQNWVCVPDGNRPQSIKTAKMISNRIKLAAFLPLIKRINPAVIN